MSISEVYTHILRMIFHNIIYIYLTKYMHFCIQEIKLHYLHAFTIYIYVLRFYEFDDLE